MLRSSSMNPRSQPDEATDGVPSRAARWLTWWRVSGDELQRLAAALAELHALAPPADATAASLARADLAALSDRVADAEVKCAALAADNDLLRALAGGNATIPST